MIFLPRDDSNSFVTDQIELHDERMVVSIESKGDVPMESKKRLIEPFAGEKLPKKAAPPEKKAIVDLNFGLDSDDESD